MQAAAMRVFLLAIALASLTERSFSQATQHTVPKTEVTTLSGHPASFPTAGSQRPLLLLLTFSHKGSEDLSQWSKHAKVAYASDPRIDLYELSDFQGVPPFIMKMILHGMRRSVQEPERSRSAPFYTNEEQWKKLVSFEKPNVVYAVLATANGEVLWQTQGPASDTKAAELESAITKAQPAQR
jgi:hypothetical protein